MRWILLLGMLSAVLLLVSCTQTAQLTQEADPELEIPEENADVVVPGMNYDVVIENDQFMPSALGIKVGDTITWTNKDDAEHTVTFDNGAVDEKLSIGGSVSHTFTDQGEFTYLCQIHPEMQGKVLVE